MPGASEPLPLLPTTVVGSHARPSWYHLAAEAIREGRFGTHDTQETLDHAWVLVDYANGVRAWPTDSGADVVKACKGKTSYYLRREFPHLRKLPSMWTRSYFVSTAGTISRATIQAYIDAQKDL